MSEGVLSVANLETLSLSKSRRNQIARTRSLIFSSASSLIRHHFKKEEPEWITIKTTVGDKWSACLQTLEGHSDSVSAVAFSHDSTRLASASDDGTIKVWDAGSGACLQTLKAHGDWVNVVTFSHNSTRLASGSNDGTLKIWDVCSGKCVQTLEGHSAVAFSHDSTQLASASDDNTVKIWDARNEKCLQTLDIDIGTLSINAASNATCGVTDIQTPRYQGVTLSPDGAWITYSSENLVWLPSEYRPSCSAVSGKTIGIGVGSGKVWICTLNVTEF